MYKVRKQENTSRNCVETEILHYQPVGRSQQLGVEVPIVVSVCTGLLLHQLVYDLRQWQVLHTQVSQ